MKTVTFSARDDSVEVPLSVLKAATKELTAIRKANKAADMEIRRLQASTRKKLGRIRENLGHGKATR